MSATFFLLTVSIPLFIGDVLAMIEVVIRRDLGLGRKVLWVPFLWFVPAIGLATYMLVRPRRHARFRTLRSTSPNESAVALVALAEAFQRGEIDAAEYDANVQRFRPPAIADQRVS